MNVNWMPKNACRPGRDWVGTMSLKTAWNTCARADWMLWLAGHAKVDRKTLVAIAADCAESAPGHAKVPAAVECIRVLRLWIDNKATLDEVRLARRAAAAASDAASDDAASAAASAAADSASAASAYVAADSASAASAYVAADSAADAGFAARSKQQALMAGLVRARLPFTVIAGLLGVTK